MLCSTDILAGAVLQAAQERRWLAPDNWSVVGFDDTWAEYMSLLLTGI